MWCSSTLRALLSTTAQQHVQRAVLVVPQLASPASWGGLSRRLAAVYSGRAAEPHRALWKAAVWS